MISHQDFSRKNLRGRSFRDQDLTGANFTYADIRGADFTNANLTGANFRNAKAGHQLHWVIFLTLLSLLLSLQSGIFAALPGALLAFSLNYQTFKVYSIISGSLFITLIIGGFAIVYQIIIAADLQLTGLKALWVSLVFGFGLTGAVTVGVAVGIATVLSTSVGVVAIVLAVTATGVEALVSFLMVHSRLSAMAGDAIRPDIYILIVLLNILIIFSIVLALGGAGAGIYGAWVALAGDDAYTYIRIPIITFAIAGGTSFRGANLTNADFTGATLKNTDFLSAILDGTRWKEVRNLDRARVCNSILDKKAIRDLLVTGNGYKKSYVGANLRGANLMGANLNEANLKGADINLANLRRANLEDANLTKVQAIGTDFSYAYLTGACLEGWNIHNTTKLENVDIRFFYILAEPDSENEICERCPSSGEFARGEFINLFAKVLNSVDLVFQKRVDWKAFGAAFKEVQVENQGLKLFIQSIENYIHGVIIINVGVPSDANKGEIQYSFSQAYEATLKALEAEYKEKLKDQDV